MVQDRVGTLDQIWVQVLGPDRAEIKGVPMARVGFVFAQSVVKKSPIDAV